MKKCIFCKIVAGELEAHKVYENKHVLAFAPLEKDVLAKGGLTPVKRDTFLAKLDSF